MHTTVGKVGWAVGTCTPAVEIKVKQHLDLLAKTSHTPGYRDNSNVVHPDPVQIVRILGKRGCPFKVIAPAYLQEAFKGSRRLGIERLATALGVHRHTLVKYLEQNGIHYKFTRLTNAEIDALVKGFCTVKPDSGFSYLVGYIHILGHCLQRRRVQASLQRVDVLGSVLRQNTTIKRRVYKVPQPNALWHLDGHHKLIFWGIVIHGIIDGFDRTVSVCPLLVGLKEILTQHQIVGLQASTNNCAGMVLDLFLDAVRQHGMPSHLRGDRGRENKLVAAHIIRTNGLDRGSFLWGP